MGIHRVGVLTSGGDCPGLNPGIVGAASALLERGITPLGVRRGYQGLVGGHKEGENLVDLSSLDRSRWLHEGGTMLGSRRLSLSNKDVLDEVIAGVGKLNLDGLIVFGGDGSLKSARLLADAGIPVVGVPKTIDRDVPGTDDTIGYSSAVEIGCEMVERIRTTARSHGTVFVVEVMGRRAGHLAVGVGVSSGADGVLVSEAQPMFSVLVEQVKACSERGDGAVIVMSEGCWFGDLDIPEQLKDRKGRMKLGWAGIHLEQELATRGVNVRSVRLGHTLRGGRPVAMDRLLALSMGQLAGRSLGKSGLVSTRSGNLGLRDFSELASGRRMLGEPELDLIRGVLWG